MDGSPQGGSVNGQPWRSLCCEPPLFLPDEFEDVGLDLFKCGLPGNQVP
jgi:hypothetical protein